MLTVVVLLQLLFWFWYGKELWNVLLLILTGGLMLVLICLVFWYYFVNNIWLLFGLLLVF